MASNEEKKERKHNKNHVLIIGVVVAFIIGLVVGIFAAPSLLFHGSMFSHGGHSGPAKSATTSSVHYNYSVNVATYPGIGQYLVNQTGWALYMYVPDTPNSGKSTCYGQCATVWPIFYTSNLTVGPGVNMSLFSVINRTDGTKELTYNGYPLYYYEFDTGANDINGQGVGGIWYVLSPTGAVIRNNT